MNGTIARALIKDAYYQVLDNKVFRLLVVLAIVLVALTFLISFRDDGISLLFGWKTLRYSDIVSQYGGQASSMKDSRIAAIQWMQKALVQGLAGSIGILFCIAATAFFVPRMLERGAADILFAKPVSRSVLLLSRYVAGLLFVATLSFLLVLGMHVGFLVSSGYSDPGFLWGALTLVYVYALVQSVSVLVAVLTRNSVAAILATLLFFTFNGCIHGIWVQKEWAVERDRAQTAADDSSSGAMKISPDTALLKFLSTVLDGFHYALPKTNDADVLTKKLRTIVVGRQTVLEDEAGKLAIARDPEDFGRVDPAEKLDTSTTPAVWVARLADKTEVGRIQFSRRSRMVERPAPAGAKDPKPRVTRQSAFQAANDWIKTLEVRTDLVDRPVKEHDPSFPLSFERVRWAETGDHGKLLRERIFFTIEDSLCEVDVSLRSDWLDDERRQGHVQSFLDGIRATQNSAAYLDPATWYDKQFGWSAPFRYNAFASLLTSIAFAVILLGAAAWRLSRVDF